MDPTYKNLEDSYAISKASLWDTSKYQSNFSTGTTDKVEQFSKIIKLYGDLLPSKEIKDHQKTAEKTDHYFNKLSGISLSSLEVEIKKTVSKKIVSWEEFSATCQSLKVKGDPVETARNIDQYFRSFVNESPLVQLDEKKTIHFKFSFDGIGQLIVKEKGVKLLRLDIRDDGESTLTELDKGENISGNELLKIFLVFQSILQIPIKVTDVAKIETPEHKISLRLLRALTGKTPEEMTPWYQAKAQFLPTNSKVREEEFNRAVNFLRRTPVSALEFFDEGQPVLKNLLDSTSLPSSTTLHDFLHQLLMRSKDQKDTTHLAQAFKVLDDIRIHFSTHTIGLALETIKGYAYFIKN